ncbi:FAD-dependent monooxygenase [Streptomyces longwoodensis]|uniref:FAD-dependent oxidoreductase n=1 Tax=Streptomyces longwoodensis TaxID=68231 RepID=UPI002E7FF796|nr:FAD-dependent monooxygenase [Streptomyces longwoodensis]WTI49181.1 FAD-dependent monooxygenase [Streptomyces longwoodensis]WUC61882.1 FAD-dependent monooxygenase [Streptomyces longwoodensis]
MTNTRSAVVLGGGMAGMLVSSMLARHVGSVTVIDRDEFPAGPDLRKGVPQARHAHILWSGGARIVEELLPGTTDRLLGAGAHRIGIPDGQVSFTAYGWQHRFPEAQFMIACSRALLDWTVREETLREERIALVEKTEVLALLGDAGRVTGVRVRDQESGEEREVPADLVVDTTGRGSPSKRLLAELGVPAPEEEFVDSGMVYATRLFRAPEAAATNFPLVSVHADHRAGRPGCNAVLMPIEDGRWIVTVSGTRGGEPPADDEGFARFARDGVRHPLVGELIAKAQPLTSVERSRSTVNRRLHYDRLATWPEGLVVLGDAVAAFNPVYGHGMSAAAHSVLALRAQLGQRAFQPGLARAAQRAIAVAVDDAWVLATSHDIGYPGCRTQTRDPRLTRHAGERQRVTDLVGLTATRNQVVNRAAVALNTLSAGMASMQDPAVMAAVRRGPEVPAPTEPPLRPDEVARLVSGAGVTA